MKCNGKEGIGEFSEFEPELFEANFEAWQYGPVDRELYRKYKDDAIKEVSLPTLIENIPDSLSDTVASYLDDMLE